eukprot:Ihof_evm13s63 gene=Ihof_evmTU13s63
MALYDPDDRLRGRQSSCPDFIASQMKQFQDQLSNIICDNAMGDQLQKKNPESLLPDNMSAEESALAQILGMGS